MIITKMGIRILERGDVIRGSPVVQPNDDLFWFRRPQFLLFLIHFVSFAVILISTPTHTHTHTYIINSCN